MKWHKLKKYTDETDHAISGTSFTMPAGNVYRDSSVRADTFQVKAHILYITTGVKEVKNSILKQGLRVPFNVR
ncbi:MAG TPA: hypothetical protein VFC58_09245 [Desulfosporosinus sp.]|nr:hypothetical protein [Desulfosporosinus sp.]